MIITRGPQGAGKSTTIRRLGLEPWLISADRVRETLAGPVLGLGGRFGVSQDHESRVWSELKARLNERMARGELLVMDATHPNAKAFKLYRDLAKVHRYRLACLDFSGIALERCLTQNKMREPHRVVPEGVLRKTWESCQAGQVPDDVLRIEVDDDGAFEGDLHAFLDVPVEDLSSYREVLHIGDLQGCVAPVHALLDGGFRDDTFYLFVGDLCDRGPENDAAFKLIFENLARPNLRVLWGNHEDHLHRWAKGLECRSDEFELRTLPQLVAAGIRPEDADALCDALHDVVLYRYRGTQVMVCHAGMSTVPERPAGVSSHQWARGVGFYASPIDAIFDERAPAGWVQVHGHRNTPELPIEASPRSFNLEGKVEFGGFLRALRLSDNGFHPVSIKSTRYRTIQEVVRAGALRNKKMYPHWVTADLGEPALDEALLAKLRTHELIYERPAPSRPWISAFNFTRDAFFDAKWDELNLTARGLFVDPERLRIVARSYDKFFNVGERPETAPEALAKLAFPVSVWVKENGFLGLAGYDERTDEIVWASKSSLESDFAGWLREIAEATIPARLFDKLRRYLRDAQATFVFEVIDPERDPHMIAYDEAKLVLLDVVRRAPTFERMAYPGLQRVGKAFGLEVKERAASLSNPKALDGFLTTADATDYLWQGRPIEGFVLEDAAGFQCKVKLDYYRFWKRVRGLKERIRKVRGTDKPLARDISDPRIHAFYEWAMRQPDEVLAKDIGAVRALFLAGVDTAWTPPPKRPDGQVRGFARALEALGERSEIKPSTAEQLLEKALANDEMMELLRDSPLRIGLLLAAPQSDQRQEAAERLGVDLDEGSDPT